MARPLMLVPLAVLAAGGLVGCSMYLDVGRADRGATVTEDREVADVAVLDFAGSGDVTLRVGEPALSVTGGRNVLDDLVVDVQGDTLVIDLDNGWRDPGRLTFDLTLPNLSSVRLSGSGSVVGEAAGTGSRQIDLSGSGQIELDGAEADDLTVTVGGSGQVDLGDVAASTTSVAVDGSGQVRLDGRTDELTARIPGSGHIDAGGLTAQRAVAAVGGSGSIDVHAEETLDASVTGSGSITYAGDATVTRSVTGSGQITPR